MKISHTTEIGIALFSLSMKDEPINKLDKIDRDYKKVIEM